VEYVHELTADVDIPSMQELGFAEEEIPMLADKAFNDPQTIGNPRDVDAAGYRKIYQHAFDLGGSRGGGANGR
jgi:choline dehydrogenase